MESDCRMLPRGETTIGNAGPTRSDILAGYGKNVHVRRPQKTGCFDVRVQRNARHHTLPGARRNEYKYLPFEDEAMCGCDALYSNSEVLYHGLDSLGK